MVRIAISAEAFEAIAAMLASGNVLHERERTAQGGYLVWLDETVVNNLKGCGGRATGPQRRPRPAVRRAGQRADRRVAWR
jgi:hypothetical protein